MLQRKLGLLSKAVGASTFAVSSEKVAVKLIVSNPGWRRARHAVGLLADGPVQWDGWRLAQGLESFHFFVSLILVTESPFSCTTQTRAGSGGEGGGGGGQKQKLLLTLGSWTPGGRGKFPFPTQLSDACVYFVMYNEWKLNSLVCP